MPITSANRIEQIQRIISLQDDALAVRQGLCNFILELHREFEADPAPVKVWTPGSFIRFSLPEFFAESKKRHNIAFADAVIEGIIDAATRLPSCQKSLGIEFAAGCVVRRKEVLECYVSDEQRLSLAQKIERLPAASLDAFTSRMTYIKDAPSASDIFAPPGILLSNLLIQRQPELAKTVDFQELCYGVKWLNILSPDVQAAASAVCKSVLSIHLDPRQPPTFALHLASAPKGVLSNFAWAMHVMVNECHWTTDDIRQLGDRRSLRYLEKAITRACLVEGTKQIRVPPADALARVKSIVRQATLSRQAEDVVGVAPRPSTPKM